ncbi:MAG: cupin domain-containing protein [Gemmatimonadales bacterium]|nr:MAG: cupin domain-containing protein [Gemmatimonadales bacterium]
MSGAGESFRSVPEGVLETVTPVGATAEPALPLSPRKVEKPWGHEIIWAHTDRYVGKILFVRAGEAMSLQFHEVKDETLHLLDGEIRLEVGRAPRALESCDLKAGESIHIRPGLLHQITALTDCRILEASTPELDDVVRIRDRYGRAES